MWKSSTLLKSAYQRKKISYKVIAGILENEFDQKLDAKTIGNYINGITRPPLRIVRNLALAIFAKRDERNNYLQTWKDEESNLDSATEKKRMLDKNVRLTKAKGYFAKVKLGKYGRYKRNPNFDKEMEPLRMAYVEFRHQSNESKGCIKVFPMMINIHYKDRIIPYKEDMPTVLKKLGMNRPRKHENNLLNFIAEFRKYCKQNNLNTIGVLETIRRAIHESDLLEKSTYLDREHIFIEKKMLKDWVESIKKLEEMMFENDANYNSIITLKQRLNQLSISINMEFEIGDIEIDKDEMLHVLESIYKCFCQ